MRTLRASVLRVPSARFARGVTMIELMVVIGIMSVLLALGVAAYRASAQKFKDEGAAMEVESALRLARNSALTRRAPAFVEFDKKGKIERVIPWAYQLVGYWSFEDAGAEAKGAFNQSAMVSGCAPAEGKIGKGLVFSGVLPNGQAVQGHVDCGTNPDFDCEEGGYLEAYIFGFHDFTGTQYVFSKKNCYSLVVTRDGVLKGTVGGITAESTHYHIPPRRWTKVAFSFDRLSTRVLVDDAVVGIGPGAQTPIKDTPLLIGHEEASLLGMIDEVKVLTAIRGRPKELPYGTKIVHDAKPWNAVFYASDGTLDMRFHPQPVTVHVVRGRKERDVTISMLGLTKRSGVRDTGNREEEEEAARQAALPRPKPVQIDPLTMRRKGEKKGTQKLLPNSDGTTAGKEGATDGATQEKSDPVDAKKNESSSGTESETAPSEEKPSKDDDTDME